MKFILARVVRSRSRYCNFVRPSVCLSVRLFVRLFVKCEHHMETVRHRNTMHSTYYRPSDHSNLLRPKFMAVSSTTNFRPGIKTEYPFVVFFCKFTSFCRMAAL